MFYAHLEGRKAFVQNSIDAGLRGACYNIVYPPDPDDVASDFEILINPQTFRLTFPASTRAPKVQHILSPFGELSALDLATLDADGRAVELTATGRRIADHFLIAQDALGATEVLAPYYAAASVTDPLLDISILSALYVEDRTDKHVFCGVMLDSDILLSPNDLEQLANRLTTPNPPNNFYFDLNLNSSPKRPLRNPATLSVLKVLFDAMDEAEKYSLLARCNIEGLLLCAATGLDAFSSSYFQSERQPLHNRLAEDYVAPPEQIRAPTPYLFSPALMTDIPRPLVQRLVNEGFEEFFECDCGSCTVLLGNAELVNAARYAPVHYNACMTTLNATLDEAGDVGQRSALILNWIEHAEQIADDIGRAAVAAGTFTHLAQWKAWVEELLSSDDDE
jgi:hypothetical protein